MRQLLLATLLLSPVLGCAQLSPGDTQPLLPQGSVQQLPQNLDPQVACYMAGLPYSEGATVMSAGNQVRHCRRLGAVINGRQPPLRWTTPEEVARLGVLMR